MQKLQRQALKKSRLAHICQLKLNQTRNELASIDEHLNKVSDSLDQAKENLESVSQNTRNYITQGNICPMRLHNFHGDLGNKATVLKNKEKEMENALTIKKQAAKDYMDAMRINNFWQEKTQIASADIRNLKQKAQDKVLNEIYLNNSRGRHD